MEHYAWIGSILFDYLWPLLLTWIKFNTSMMKITSIIQWFCCCWIKSTIHIQFAAGLGSVANISNSAGNHLKNLNQISVLINYLEISGLLTIYHETTKIVDKKPFHIVFWQYCVIAITLHRLTGNTLLDWILNWHLYIFHFIRDGPLHKCWFKFDALGHGNACTCNRQNDRLSRTKRGSNSLSLDWTNIASCQLSSTCVSYHRNCVKNTIQMTWPRRHWTSDNPSEMQRC